MLELGRLIEDLFVARIAWTPQRASVAVEFRELLVDSSHIGEYFPTV